MTRWRSDTCSCDIEFDDAGLQITRVNHECTAHVGQHLVGDPFVGCPSQSYNFNFNKANPIPSLPTALQAQTYLSKKSQAYIN